MSVASPAPPSSVKAKDRAEMACRVLAGRGGGGGRVGFTAIERPGIMAGGLRQIMAAR